MTDLNTKSLSLKEQIKKIEAENKKLKQQYDEILNRRMVIFSNLNHEIRTPLNGIVGFSDALNASGVSENDYCYYSGQIKESANLLLSIVNDVTDIARVEAGQMKVYPVKFDLNDLIFKIFFENKLKAEEKELQFFLENLISESFVIYSDSDVLEKILTRLLENAIKFTKNGWVKLSYRVEENQIIFVIEDTGIGIDESLHNTLFNRFVTNDVSKSRKIGGPGLDLSLCSGLVKLLDGTIWYESEVGVGSKFYFSIKNIFRED